MLTRPHLALALAALGLMLPSLVWGTLPSHSSMHNLTWAAQFSDQVLAGRLYPRWLPESFGGLGAPTFYFYPPLAFWVDALVRVVTIDLLSTSWRLSLTSAALLFASGVAMHAWLRLQDVERRTALIGALAYMAAPYHLIDHYLRGALAEFAAYAALPLVMVGIVLVMRRHRAGILMLAVGYAALVTAHLPTALLISITAVPAYIVFSAVRVGPSDRFFLLRCALGLGLGLGLCAPYLWPALTLQSAVLIDWMWRAGFQVDHGLLLFPARWVQPEYMFVVIASCAAGWLLATLSLLGQRGGALLWAAVSLATLLLMSGVVPGFWQLPMVSRVGFPWRLLIVVEFAAITGLCLASWPPQRLARLALLLALAGFAPALTVTARGIGARVEMAIRGEAPPEQDAREYLPAGFPQRPDAGYADLDLDAVTKLPTIACDPEPRLCRAEPGRFGSLRLELEADAPTTVVLKRFAFPAWQLDPPLPLGATEPYRLISFTVPSGHHAFTLDRRMLPVERWGWAVGGVALGLALLSLWRRAASGTRRSG